MKIPNTTELKTGITKKINFSWSTSFTHFLLPTHNSAQHIYSKVKSGAETWVLYCFGIALLIPSQPYLVKAVQQSIIFVRAVTQKSTFKVKIVKLCVCVQEVLGWYSYFTFWFNSFRFPWIIARTAPYHWDIDLWWRNLIIDSFVSSHLPLPKKIVKNW